MLLEFTKKDGLPYAIDYEGILGVEQCKDFVILTEKTTLKATQINETYEDVLSKIRAAKKERLAKELSKKYA